MQSSLFEPGRPVSVVVCVARKLRPCPSYSRRRDRINLGLWRSLYRGGGIRYPSCRAQSLTLQAPPPTRQLCRCCTCLACTVRMRTLAGLLAPVPMPPLVACLCPPWLNSGPHHVEGATPATSMPCGHTRGHCTPSPFVPVMHVLRVRVFVAGLRAHSTLHTRLRSRPDHPVAWCHAVLGAKSYPGHGTGLCLRCPLQTFLTQDVSLP